MSQPEKLPTDPFRHLMPHQLAFVEMFFAPESKRFILLHGDVGLGKTTTLVILAERLLRQRPTARVLMLATHRALQSHLLGMLRAAGTPAMLVDRYRYRELLDASTGGEFWPRGVVSILSVDLAKQPDIQASLIATRWDAVIADEAHSIVGTVGTVLQQIGSTAGRVVLATATVTRGLEAEFPSADTTVVTWRRDQLVDHDGRPFEAPRRAVVKEVSFGLSSDELTLVHSVGALCQVIEDGTPQRGWIAKAIRRSVLSSPAALERSLQRLVDKLEVWGRIDETVDREEEDPLEITPTGRLDLPTADRVVTIGRRALQELENTGVDSKLRAFTEMLGRFGKSNLSSRRICVVTERLATLYYLASELEASNAVCHLLQGAMTIADRSQSLARFVEDGGVLVATSASMTEGVDLPEVTDVVLYDLPEGEVALQKILGRFDRVGRSRQLIVHVLAPSDMVDGVVPESVEFVRRALDPPGGAPPAE